MIFPIRKKNPDTLLTVLDNGSNSPHAILYKILSKNV